MKKKALDILKCTGLLFTATVVGMTFHHYGFSESNIIMVYILGVLVTAIVTEHRIYSLIASAVSVVVFNFFFTDPHYSLRAYDKEYTATFIVMFLVAFIAGSLTDQLKTNIRQKDEAVLLAKNEQLRADLLRSISHDLRTPLTSISGNASNLLYNGGSFDEVTKKQLYSDIYDDSMWLINLVENLLSTTRIEDGRIDLHLSSELIDEVIDEALKHIDRHSAEHKIVVDNTDELILAKVDVSLMLQVITNLVNNAIKYTQEGSEIRISTRKEDGWVKVQVADDGPGISDQDKKRVFEKFYGGMRETSDGRRGIGLGLFLCKLIVNAHGGEITVADNTPKGTIFTFTLPAGEVLLHE